MASVRAEVCEGEGSGLERWATTSQEPPFVWSTIPLKGEMPNSSPCNLRPKGGRSPSHGKHYSQLQLWQPSSPGGALTCTPKVTCPLPPDTPRDSISSPSGKTFRETITLFSYPRNSSPVPTRPPKTDVLVWFDPPELTHTFWPHFSLPVGAA